MERHPVFVRMRDDHREVLREVESLDQAIEESRPSLEPEARRLVALLDLQFSTHMRLENDVLFPWLLKELPETAAMLRELRQEHQDLHAILGALREAIARTPDATREVQMRVHVRDLADLLRIHVRKEEAYVFHIAERVLGADRLQLLAENLMLSSKPERDTP